MSAGLESLLGWGGVCLVLHHVDRAEIGKEHKGCITKMTEEMLGMPD